jgi:hypothetical protein
MEAVNNKKIRNGVLPRITVHRAARITVHRADPFVRSSWTKCSVGFQVSTVSESYVEVFLEDGGR